MNSPDVVAALRTGAPDAAGQLYDAHAEDLYQYCWLILRSRDAAQVAVRDAIILAGALIAELDDPAMLKAWLFAIARAECDRHCPGSAGESDEPVARPQQRDAALRIMAWNSVISLPADEREALDLLTRHGMTAPEMARVLGLPGPHAPALLTAGQQHLEQALTAEILINRDSQECAGRAEALQGWTGMVTPAVRERLLRHAGPCPACQPWLPHNVSAAKIFGLIPRPAMTEGGWAGVLGRLSDPEPPDRVAAAPRRAAPVSSAGEDRPGPADHDPARAATAIPDRDNKRGHCVIPRGRRRRVLAGTGAVLAVAAIGIAAVLAVGGLGGHASLSGDTGHLPAATAAPAQAGVGQPIWPVPNPAAPGNRARCRSSLSRPLSANDAPPDDGPGQLTRATVTATPSVIIPARTPQRAMGVALLPSPAVQPSPGSPVSPASPASPVSPAAAAVPPSAAARPPASGQLEVSPGRLDLGTDSAGQIVLTAEGGPVGWTAGASSPDLTMSQSSGQLQAGQSVTVLVEVQRPDGAGGSAAISINATNSTTAVQVTWDTPARPAPRDRRWRHQPDSPRSAGY
jgi:DNA-directed RNA polymerase specialized sigma24 family protein